MKKANKPNNKKYEKLQYEIFNFSYLFSHIDSFSIAQLQPTIEVFIFLIVKPIL